MSNLFRTPIVLIGMALIGITQALAWADGVPELPTDLKYEVIGGSGAQIEGQRIVKVVDSYFNGDGFVGILPPPDEHNPLHLMDRVYVRAEFTRSVFFKTNVRFKNAQFLGKLIQSDGVFLYHGRSPQGIYYAVYLLHYSEDQARAAVQDIERVLNSTARAGGHSITNEIAKNSAPALRILATVRWVSGISQIPTAYADSNPCAQYEQGSPSANVSTIRSSLNEVGRNIAAQGANSVGCVWGTLNGAATGAYDGTVGALVGIGKAIWNYRETASSIVKAGKFVMDHTAELSAITNKWLSEHYADYLKLSPYEQGKVVCKTIASVGIQGAIIGFTAGAGGAGLAARIGEVLSQLGQSGKIAMLIADAGTRVAQAGSALSDAGKVAEGVEDAAALGKAAQETLGITTTAKLTAQATTATGKGLVATGNAIQAAAPAVGRTAEAVAATPVIGPALTRGGAHLADVANARVAKLVAKQASDAAISSAKKAEKTLKALRDAVQKGDEEATQALYAKLRSLTESAVENQRIAEAAAEINPKKAGPKVLTAKSGADRALSALKSGEEAVKGGADELTPTQPLTRKQAGPKLAAARARLADPAASKAQKLQTIRELGNLKFKAEMDFEPLDRNALAIYNDQLIAVLDDLALVVKTHPDSDVRLSALRAMARYARAASKEYTTGYLGMMGPDRFRDIYYDSNIPDDLRKIAFDEMAHDYAQNGLGTVRPFQTAQELLAKENPVKDLSLKVDEGKTPLSTGKRNKTARKTAATGAVTAEPQVPKYYAKVRGSDEWIYIEGRGAAESASGPDLNTKIYIGQSGLLKRAKIQSILSLGGNERVAPMTVFTLDNGDKLEFPTVFQENSSATWIRSDTSEVLHLSNIDPASSDPIKPPVPRKAQWFTQRPDQTAHYDKAVEALTNGRAYNASNGGEGAMSAFVTASGKWDEFVPQITARLSEVTQGQVTLVPLSADEPHTMIMGMAKYFKLIRQTRSGETQIRFVALGQNGFIFIK